MMKTPQPEMMVMRRPIQSASEPAKRAPKKAYNSLDGVDR